MRPHTPHTLYTLSVVLIIMIVLAVVAVSSNVSYAQEQTKDCPSMLGDNRVQLVVDGPTIPNAQTQFRVKLIPPSQPTPTNTSISPPTQPPSEPPSEPPATPTEAPEPDFPLAHVLAASFDQVDAPYTFIWDFGDPYADDDNPLIAQGEVVTHTYQFSRDYTVKLKVPNQNFVDCPITISIGTRPTPTIVQAPPRPIEGLLVTVDPPLVRTVSSSVKFYASVAQGDKVTYEWNFNDGSDLQYGQTQSHVFKEAKPAPGYKVVVTASNAAVTGTNRVSEIVYIIVIDEAPAEPQIEVIGEKIAGQPIKLIGHVGSGTGVRYTWRSVDLWGDEDRSGETVTVTYPRPGEYTIVMTAENSEGTVRLNWKVRIAPRSVQNLAIYGVNQPGIGESVRFSLNADGDRPTQYEIDYDMSATYDETETKEQTESDPSIVQFEYRYPVKGRYLALITASNVSGKVSAFRVVHVDEPELPRGLKLSWLPISPYTSTAYSEVPENPIVTIPLNTVFFFQVRNRQTGDLLSSDYTITWEFKRGFPVVKPNGIDVTFNEPGYSVIHIEARRGTDPVLAYDAGLLVSQSAYLPIVTNRITGTFGTLPAQVR